MAKRITRINQGLIQINICVLLLGGTSLFAKLISLPADTITFYRSVFGCTVLAMAIAFTRTPFRLAAKKDYMFMVVTGALTGGHWISFFHSMQISTVAIGIISLYTFPAVTSILEPIIDGEKIQKGTLIRAMMVLIGIVLVLPHHDFDIHNCMGVFWGLVSSFSFSVRNILVRKTLDHVSGITTMYYQLFTISLMLFPFISFHESIFAENRLCLLLVLSVLFTVFPHVLLVLSLQSLKAATASLILCLHPMYSVIFAALLISEIPGTRVIAGGFIIVAISAAESLRLLISQPRGR